MQLKKSKSNTGIKGQRGHVRPCAPNVDLDKPARLRSKHLLHLYNMGHSTFQKKLKSGELPAPDGYDGRNFWRTATIKSDLEGA